MKDFALKHKRATNLDWQTRALAVMPGKNSNVRRGAQAEALFFERSEGARYFDVEGRDYIDYVAGMGPAIWGHSHREYLDAIKAQIDHLFSIGSTVAQTTLEVELAEKIVEYVPGAEWVRLGISGSEADQLALRIARAYTKKPLILRFENHYHGWMDNLNGGRAPQTLDTAPHPLPVDTDTGGLGPEARDGSLMVRWNDATALEVVLDRYADRIAMVLMEPVMLNFGCCPPRPGYLAKVRELCETHDVLLCFDEVFTGFRLGLGGAQGQFGVTPDLTILAKAIAGGMPLSAVAGKRRIMQVLRDDLALVGGTFNSFPLAVAAALKNLELLARDDGAFYRRIDETQTRLMQGIRDIGARYAHPIFLQGPRGVFHLNFAAIDRAYSAQELLAAADLAKLSRFSKLLLQERVLVGGGSRWVITDALTEADIEETLTRVERVMQKL